MSDFTNHLPLSQRSGDDESAVTGDRRPLIGQTLHLVADLLESLDAADWDRPSLCAGWRVRDVAGHLVWRVGSTGPELARSAASAVLRDRVSPLKVLDATARRAAEAPPAELTRRLREIADARLAGHGRHGVHELAEAVVHGYDIARALDRTLNVPANSTGAVALARTVAAPAGIKAVVRGRTLVAADAGWTIGRGPKIEGTAEAHILFLYGRSDRLPTPLAGVIPPEKLPDRPDA